MRVIEDRKQNPSEKSYTTTLLAGGTAKIAEKILEEAQEVVEAAEETDASAREHLIYEAADLIFHLMVKYLDAEDFIDSSNWNTYTKKQWYLMICGGSNTIHFFVRRDVLDVIE